MLLSPSIMALILVSALVSLMMLIASGFAIQILRFWDIHSGSELQLNLERRTYLISTLLAWVFAAELFSLLLFVYNAEDMSGQFVGAMCATGVLNANEWGWPTLFLKITLFFAGSSWLLLNRLDNKGFDYPFDSLEISLFIIDCALVFAEFFVQIRFFLAMNPDVITSCCGALFSADSEGVAAEVSGLKPKTAFIALLISGAAVFLSGFWFYWRQKAAWFFALSGGIAFVVALIAIVSFISLYVYEHPHHHCPFCLLKAGHGYVGYYLYIPLFTATAFALGIGLLAPWKKIPSLKTAAQQDTKRLTTLSLIGFALFYLISGWLVINSNLTMLGVWWK